MKKNNFSKTIIHIILILGSLSMIFPFLWMLLTSLKTFTETTAMPPTIFPEKLQWVNYIDIWSALPFTDFFLNTFVMMIVRVILALFFSSMAGYILARAEFPGKKLFFLIVLIQMMIPGQIFILPQYLMVSSLGWLNTIKALVFPGLVSAFGTFLMRQLFMSLPNDLEEAAVLDGCNRWQIYWNVMLPLTGSGLVALGIFTALFAWKDLLWPLIVNMSVTKMPLSSGLATIQSQYYTNFAQLMSGAMISIIPMILIFAIFQKQFIQGIATTGSKT